MAGTGGMNMGPSSSNIISELKSVISSLTQATTTLVQNVGSSLSKVSSFGVGGGRGGASSNKIAPDPDFKSAPQVTALTESGHTILGGNIVAAGPSSTNVPATTSNLSQYVSQNPGAGTLYNPVFYGPKTSGSGAWGTGGGGGTGGFAGTASGDPSDYYGQGGGSTFGYNSSGANPVSRFLSNFARNASGAIMGNPVAAALGGFGLLSNLIPSTADAVEMNLLQQRAAYFGGTSYSDIVSKQAQFAKAATLSSESPNMDTIRAMVAAQSYGLVGPNFENSSGSFGSLMGGAANVSNLLPGMGMEGVIRATGAMQQARNVNMLRGIGIRIRDEDGNLKAPDKVIDDIWTKITRDYAQAYGAGKIPSLKEVQIGLQPGNSLDSMLDTYFGNDPLLKQMIANGLIYKAQTGGGAITKAGVAAAGGTTEAVLAYSTRGATEAAVLGSSAATGVEGFISATGQVTGVINSISDALANSALFKIKTYIDTWLAAFNGAPGNIVDTLVSFSAFKADGGPVTAANTYIVGERGPEIFVPATSGTIISNEQIRQATSENSGAISNNTYNFTVNVPNANTPEVIAALRNLLSELETNKRVSEY